eukprot:988567-Pelagomonas_calceolata.AAC.1
MQACTQTQAEVTYLSSQVDGFRFDIMGHMLLRTLNKMRAALDGLTVEKDGVDGKWVVHACKTMMRGSLASEIE